MAYLGTRRPLGNKMLGHRKPLMANTLGYKMAGSEPPINILTRELEQRKQAGGLERVRRNGGWASLGNYAGA